MLCESLEPVQGWRTPVACDWRAHRNRLSVCEISGVPAEAVVEFFASRYGTNLRWEAGRLDVTQPAAAFATPARLIGNYDGQTWRLTFVQADPPNQPMDKPAHSPVARPTDP
ncbi:MAG TPA: hypothetical protein DCQ06_07040 [Myxococcales bacterium]|nr:hypothetical protein [Myxococcales bacterium]